MDCLSDIAPSEEDLIAFALNDQPLPAAEQEHLAHCERCQRRLEELRSATASLVARLYRSQCPDALSLSYYSTGGLSDERRIAIANHLLDCPLCMAEVEEAREYLREQPIDMPAPSFRPHALVRRIFATRVARPQMQFVLRSDAQETAWPRQYKAEAVDLSLHLSRTSSGEHMLLGILTSNDPSEDVEALEGIEAELYTAPLHFTGNGHGPRQTPFLLTQVDDMGNIVFKPVPQGEYVMILRLPGREVIIEGLSVE